MSIICFETHDKGKIEVKLSDPAQPRPDTTIGLFNFGFLNIKLTDPEGKSIYEGGVTLLPHGEGKLYHANGNLKYEGGFCDNKYDGYGELWSEDGKIMTRGNFKDHMRNGQCKVFDAEGRIESMGSYTNDQKSGDHFCDFHPNGYLKNYGRIGEDGGFVADISYEFGEDGSLVRRPAKAEGQMNYERADEDFGVWGNVKLVHGEADAMPVASLYSENLESNDIKLPKEQESADEVLECRFPKTLCNNSAVTYYDGEHKLKYTGNFSKGKFEEVGKLYGADEARVYEGAFKADLQDGEGVTYYLSGNKQHEGGYKEGLFSGAGKDYSDATNNCLFDGEFDLGQHKLGKLYYDSVLEGAEGPTLRYDGDFNAKAEFEGAKGTEYYENGKMKYEGRFRQGLPHTQATFNATEKKEKIGPESMENVIGEKITPEELTAATADIELDVSGNDTWGVNDRRQYAWTGHFMQGDQKFDMNFKKLNFNLDGTLEGAGNDDIGNFTITGTLDNEVKFTKQYEGAHAVEYTGTQAGGTITGTWSIPDNCDGTFEQNIVSQDWTGFFMHEENKTDMALKMMVNRNGVSGLGSDDVGNFMLIGEYNNQGMMKFVKKYLGQHSVIYIGKVKRVNNDMTVVGKWTIPDNCQGTFELQGKFGDSNGLLSHHDDDHDLDYDVQLDDSGKWYDEGTGLLVFEGEFDMGQKTGWGTYYKEDGENVKYHGQFINGEPHGDFVKVYNDNNQVAYKGRFETDKKLGRGAVYNEETNNILFKGELDDEGVWHGSGTEYYDDGKVKFRGSFTNKFYTFGAQWDDKGRQVFIGSYKPESYDYDKGHLHVYQKVNPDDEASEEFLYYDGKIENGLYHGKGKYFHPNAALKYEGDFEAGLEHGVGDQFSDAGKKMYSGNFTEGRREGEKGSLFDHEGDEHLIYEGSFKDGHYVEGKLYHDNTNLKYVGPFNENNEFNGEHGKFYSEEENERIMFEGPYVNGKLEGESGCKVYYNEKDGPVLYEGGYKDDKYQHDGIVFYKSGMEQMKGNFDEGDIKNNDGQYFYETGVLMYQGPIINNLFTGEETKLYTDYGQIKYEGPMENSEQHGAGKLYHNNPDGEAVLKYEGTFKNGNYDGGPECKLYHENGNIAYEGEFVDGKMAAVQAKQYDEEGRLIYEGGFEEGIRQGMGKTLNPEDGTVIFEGGFMGGEQSEGDVTRYAEDGKTKQYQGAVIENGTIREGYGVEFYNNANNTKKYMGMWKADVWQHGPEEETKAILWNEDGTRDYEGTIVDGLKSGEGTWFQADPETKEETAKFIGTFEENLPHGKGTFYYSKAESSGNILACLDDNNESAPATQKRYEGPVVKGIMEGDEGTMYYNSGVKMYFGQFAADLFEGAGEKFFLQNEKLEYAGQFKAGMFHGPDGKLYYPTEVLQYEGEFAEGKFEGSGILYYENGTKGYEGQFSNHKYHGTGTMYDDTGVKKYEGEFVAGKFHGNGTIFFEDGAVKYTGGFADGKKSGAGKIYGAKGALLFEGNYTADQIDDANAIIYFENGNFKFKGGVQMGKYEGEGELYYNTGSLQYRGSFVNSKFEGDNGTIFNIKGNKGYEGSFKLGNPHGEGIYYDENGTKKYEGTFNVGLFNGHGKFYYDNGQVKHEGEWAMGKQHGDGVDYDKEGNETFRGLFKNGKPCRT